ncbi:kinase-like domain-containing protein [Amylostereum chailletii]|nr:kinase-like domain-containing protein [Amylostereum chailletii]
MPTDAHQIDDVPLSLELPVRAASPVPPSPLDVPKSTPSTSHAVRSPRHTEVDAASRPTKTLRRRESRLAHEFNRLIHRVKSHHDKRDPEIAQLAKAAAVPSPFLSLATDVAVRSARMSSASVSLSVGPSPPRSCAPSSLFSRSSAATSASSCPPWSSDCNPVINRDEERARTCRRSRRRALADIAPPPPVSRVPTTAPGPVPPARGSAAPGLTLADFEIITLVGEGAFGKVYLARFAVQDRLVALKLVAKDGAEMRKMREAEVLSEQAVMRAVEGVRGALPLLASWHDDAYWYFAMVGVLHMRGRFRFQLKRRSGKMPQVLVAFYIAQMIAVLEELHARNVIHRDVKPANILIDASGNAVLADFGLSRLFGAGDALPGGSDSLTDAQLHLTMRGVGTLVYMAPEVLAGTLYSHEVDLWALGVVTYEMLTGELPFGEHHDPKVLAHTIRNGDVTFWRNDVEPAARDFIRKALMKDPSSRLTVDQMKKHSFFSDIDWDAIANRTAKPPFVPPTRIASIHDLNCVVQAGTPFLPGHDPHPEFTYTSPALVDSPQSSHRRSHSAAFKAVHAMSRFLGRFVHDVGEPEFALVMPPAAVAFGADYTTVQVQRGGQWRTAVMPNVDVDVRMSMPVMAQAVDVGTHHHGHQRGKSWVRGVGSRAFGRR